METIDLNCNILHKNVSIKRTSISFVTKKFCEPKGFIINQPNVELRNIDAIDDSVQAFRVTQGGFVDYLPLNLGVKLPNLELLVFNKTGLKEVNKKELKGLENLIIISLKGNNIVELEANLFESNPRLELIDLSGNKIRFIHPKAFQRPGVVLPSINILYLLNNNCISKNVLDKNAIKALEPYVEAKCSKLSYKLEEMLDNLTVTQGLLNEKFFSINESLEVVKREVKETKDEVTRLTEDLANLLNMFPDVLENINGFYEQIADFKSQVSTQIKNVSLTQANQQENYEKNMTDINDFKEEIKEFFSNVHSPQTDSLTTKHTILIAISIGQISLIILVLSVLVFKAKQRPSSENHHKEDHYATITENLNNHDYNSSKLTVLSNTTQHINDDYADYQELSDIAKNEGIYSEPDTIEIKATKEHFDFEPDYDEIGFSNEVSEPINEEKGVLPSE